MRVKHRAKSTRLPVPTRLHQAGASKSQPSPKSEAARDLKECRHPKRGGCLHLHMARPFRLSADSAACGCGRRNFDQH